MVVGGWNLYVVSSAPCFVFTTFFIVLCADKKKIDHLALKVGGNPPPPAVKAPTTGGMAGTYDPNYQTLAGVKGDVFADKRNPPPPQAPIAPAVAGMAGTHDPNYQTLAGIKDTFDKKQEMGGAAAPPPIRAGTGGMAGTYDPNYQTLAAVNADVFNKNK